MEWKIASEHAIRSIQLFFHVTRHSRRQASSCTRSRQPNFMENNFANNVN